MKSIKKVLLFTHEKYQKNKDILRLNKFLKSKRIESELLIQTSKNIQVQSSGEIINNGKMSKKSSIQKHGMIIVFGGDGLFLSASKIAYHLDIPILGINFGKIGFLVDVDKKDIIKKVFEIVKGSYVIDKRIMINGKIIDVNEKVIQSTSLNDIVIYNYGLLKMIQAKIFINDFLINIQRSDGVIVSTPTGSTAYSMSNGCPIVSPSANVISITPISPHTYSHRPIIINSSDVIRIEIENKSIKNTLVTFDGANNLNVAHPKIIEIKKSRKNLMIAHPIDYNYFKILNKKLKWGGRS
jgi:NAD+ kinase|tara:strand:- start:2366 stop:3256 length:891 start_codon:yes stop_codon:yes gene_type:complete